MSLLRNSHCVYRYSTDQESNGSLMGLMQEQVVSQEAELEWMKQEVRKKKFLIYLCSLIVKHPAPLKHCHTTSLQNFFNCRILACHLKSLWDGVAIAPFWEKVFFVSAWHSHCCWVVAGHRGWWNVTAQNRTSLMFCIFRKAIRWKWSFWIIWKRGFCCGCSPSDGYIYVRKLKKKSSILTLMTPRPMSHL